MESLQEQIEYGDRCIHGTNIGTPGGADLMCGACEEGLTTLFTCKCGAEFWTEPGERFMCVPNTDRRRSYAAKVRAARREFRTSLGIRTTNKLIRTGWTNRPAKFTHDLATN